MLIVVIVEQKLKEQQRTEWDQVILLSCFPPPFEN